MTRTQLINYIAQRIKDFPRRPLTGSEMRDVLYKMLDYLDSVEQTTEEIVIKAENNTSNSPETGDWRFRVTGAKTFVKEKRLGTDWIIIEEDTFE